MASSRPEERIIRLVTVVGLVKISALAACGVLFFQGIRAGAATIVWADLGTDFATNANWVSGVAPANDTTTDIASFGTVTNFQPVLAANRSVNGLAFTASSVVTLSGAGGFTLGNSGISNSSVSGLKTVSNALTLAAAQSFTNNGALTISGPVTNGGNLLTLSGTGASGTLSGIVSGSGGLTKAGTALWIVSGANTYTGATTISAGVLNIQNNGALGTSASGTTVASGAALQLQGGITVTGETLTLSGTGISNDGALRNISGNNTWAGSLQLGSGTTPRINSDANSTLTISGGTIIGAGNMSQNLTVGGAGNTVISDAINTGKSTLTKDGAGTLTLSNANLYTGGTTVSAGVLNIQNNSALGTGAASVTSGATLQVQGGLTNVTNAITLSGTGAIGGGGSSLGALDNLSSANTISGAITLSSDTTINSDVNSTLNLTTGSGMSAITGSYNLTVGGAGNTSISKIIGIGTGTLTKTGAGTLTLSGANTYTGATTVSAGILQLGATNVLPSSTAVTVGIGPFGGVGSTPTLDLNNFSATVGSIAGTGNITLGSGILTTGGNNTSTTFSGVISGTGGVTKTGAGTLTLSHANTYTGATNINAGTLQLGATNALSSSTAVTVAGGATLNLNNYSDTIGSLAGAGVVTLGSGTLTVGADNTSTTFSGSFTTGGTGTFAKSGSGTLTFGAAMNLSAGTLVLNGGTLNLGNFNSTFGSLSVTADSILDFSASGSSILHLNSLTVNSGVTLTITNWADTVDYFYSVTNPGAGNLGRIVFTGFTGADTTWQSYDSQIKPVPEPATYGALLLGLSTLFAGWRRYRRRTA